MDEAEGAGEKRARFDGETAETRRVLEAFREENRALRGDEDPLRRRHRNPAELARRARGIRGAAMRSPAVALRFILALCSIPVLASLFGCAPKSEGQGPKYRSEAPKETVTEYVFAVHPLYNPSKLVESYQPLVDYLNAGIEGARIVLQASRDYAAFEDKYRARKPDIILPNPWQTLDAMQAGYAVIAMAGDPEDFRGIFVVRRDGGIGQPADLKGRTVSYPSPTALAACIMPQYFLHQHGIDINRDIVNNYVGSQDSSIMNVYLGKSSAGATWPPPWRAFQHDHPLEAGMLEVIWETESLVNNAVMTRDDLPAVLRERLRSLLASLGDSEGGRAILAGMETARFTAATDDDYEVVRSYVARFEREVRKVR